MNEQQKCRMSGNRTRTLSHENLPLHSERLYHSAIILTLIKSSFPSKYSIWGAARSAKKFTDSRPLCPHSHDPRVSGLVANGLVNCAASRWNCVWLRIV